MLDAPENETGAVKSELRRLIAAEDSRNPMSDLTLADELRRRGLPIARRTVAKYRDEIAIPPRHYRKTA